MTAKGFTAKAAYKRESTTDYGVPVTVSTRLPYISESLEKNKEIIKDEYLHRIAAYELAEISKIYVSGGISLDFVYSGLEELLLCAVGNEKWNTIVDVGGGFYEHTLEPDRDLATEPFTTTDNIKTSNAIKTSDRKRRRFTLVIDKQVSQHRFISCFVNSFTISGSPNNPVKMDLDILAYDRERTTIDSSTWQYPEGADNFKRILFSDMTFKINGNPVQIGEFSFQVNNNLLQVQSNSLYLEEPNRNGKRETTLSFKLSRYKDDTYLNQFDNDTEISVSILFEHFEGYKIEIVFPKLKYVKASATASGAEMISQSFDFVALADGTQRDFYMKLTNKINQELWRL